MAERPVERHREQNSRGNLVAPVCRHDGAAASVGVMARHGCELARRSGERHVVGLAPDGGARHVDDRSAQQPEYGFDSVAASRHARACMAVEHRALRRDRGDPRVARGGDHDVAARERAAPQRDALWVDAGHAARKFDGRGPVRELLRNGDELARLAVAGAEVPVVEQQHMKAGFGETQRIGLERRRRACR